MAFALPVAGDCCEPCSSCSITISITPGTGGSTLVVKSLAEARAITSASAATSKFLVINGFMTGGDGFMGEFTWDPLSADVDDSANFLTPDDNPVIGRWVNQI